MKNSQCSLRCVDCEKEHRGESLLTGSDNISVNGALTTAVSEALSGISETVSQRYPLRRTAAENFLYSENEKSDYDWLLTPPGTPQFEKESHRSVMNQLDAPNSRPTVLKSRLGNSREEMISGNSNKLQMSSSSGPSSSSSVAGLRRPSSSCSSRSTSRPSTPTSRSTSRPSTPTRRSTTTTTTSTARPVTTTRGSTSRSSTPTSRATLTAARATTSTAAPRTTTSTGSARSATPTRSKTQPSSSAPSEKPLSRQATPTRRPSTPTGPSIVSNKAPSRGTSPAPTVKSSRPRKPPEMPGFSLEAPPNLRTTLPDRPGSASRGRPGVASAPGSRSSSIERGSGGPTSGRQSCSPSRRRAPIGNTNGSLPSARGGRGGKANNGGNSYDSMSPVAMGNKMVERVVNMRKLGPPRVTENGGRGTVKSNSAFNSLGYGRNLSKSSIDMALRHMDIRRGMTGNLRPLVTKVPASSMYSVRSGSTSVTNSPVATSSTMSSSELSVDNINILSLDGNDAENDDLLSERSYS
ncbi:proline-rich family protein [Raphanus sativus]|nr:proline-rich family protein [Raphanus sativus]